MLKDQWGQALTGASTAAADGYDQALAQFRLYRGDPVATIDGVIAEAPGFAMAQALRAYLFLLGTEPDGFPEARRSYEALAGGSLTPREAGHRAAIAALLENRWREAGRALEDVTAEHPHDIVALQVGHLIDFYTGDSRMLRDRIGRAIRRWDEGVTGYHAVLAMHAFGLEETADYGAAEKAGRTAIAIEPRDAWAQHAVAHVMEMQGRTADGIAWMRADTDAWSRDNFFAVHNWWHLALFHLDRGDIDSALALFDGPIHGQRSAMILDLVDASALLWRLHLRGIDLGERWSGVADLWQPFARAGNYAFNDAHAMMAFVGAGRADDARALLESQERAMAGGDDNAMFTRDVGRPVTLAIQAFGAGDYARTVDLLRPVRNIAARFGGSHAQRDVLDLTLLEAALRSGHLALARALAEERISVKPTSASGWDYLKRSRDSAGRAAAA